MDADRRAGLIPLVRRTGSAMVRELIESLHRAGYADITAGHHPLFENIDAQGTRLSALAARAGVTHQSMGDLVASLERRGYVERRSDPNDGRARLVCLTPLGQRLVRRARREIWRIERDWSAAWREAGIRTDLGPVLAQVLDKRTDRATGP